MATLRQENWLGQQRVDVPHLRATESAVAADFDLIAGQMMAGKIALILKGFNIITTGTIGAPATNLLLRSADGLLMHYGASESGTLFWSPPTAADQQLNATNTKLSGSFTASQTNYVGIDLTRSADASTSDNVQFLEPISDSELSKTVPLARTLDFRISVSIADFSSQPNILPIAKVVTDSSNNVVSVIDARNLMFRLGSGGDFPNALDAYTWPGTRAENTTGDIFTGGDKNIDSLKTWMDACMTRMWEIGGGEHWYSATADRNVTLVWISPTFTNGENYEFVSSNLHWKGIRFLFDDSTAYVNDIADQTTNSAGLTDLAFGECLYVDLDRSTFHVQPWANTTSYAAGDYVFNDTNHAYICTTGGTSAGSGGPTGTGTAINDNGVLWNFVGPGATKLTAVKAPLSSLGSSLIPGQRQILAWRVGSGIYTRNWRYPIGTLFIPATTTAQGVLRISRDYLGADSGAASSLNDPVALSDRGGLITVPAVGNKGLVIKRFDAGANIFEWQTAAGSALGSIANDSTVSIPPGVKYQYTSNRTSRQYHVAAEAFKLVDVFSGGAQDRLSFQQQDPGHRSGSWAIAPLYPGQHTRATVRAPLHLPQGATLNGATLLWSYDDAGTALANTMGRINLAIWKRTGTITNTKITEDHASFTGAGGPSTIESPMGAFSTTIDNTAGATYELEIELIAMANCLNRAGTLYGSVAQGAASAVLMDGRMLVTGGYAGSTAVSTAKFVDPLTGAVSAATALNHARAGHRMYTLYDGSVLAFGGHTGDGVTRVQTCEFFNPENNTWTDISGSMTNAIAFAWIPHPRGDSVIVVGGSTAGQDKVVMTISTAAVAALASTGSSRVGTALAWFTASTGSPDQVYLGAFGGGANLATRSNTWESYDYIGNAWTAGAGTLAATRNQAVAVTMPNGGVLIAGGGAASAADRAVITNSTTIAFAAISAPPSNFTAGQGFLLRDGRVVFITASSGSPHLTYNSLDGNWQTATAGFENTYTVTADVFGGAGGGANGQFNMLRNEEIVGVNTNTPVASQLVAGLMAKDIVRMPSIRFHGLRLAYDYTEVNVEM